ncbi:hypothetical protein GCM10027053_40050 [Intrasporangium mesophilum]
MIPTTPLAGSVPAKPGRDYSVVKVVEPVGGGLTRGTLSFGSNGDVLAYESLTTADERLTPETIKFLSRSGRVVALSRAVPERQSPYGDLVGDTVVWWSTSSTNLFVADWQIWVSRHGRMGRLLADSTKVTPGRTPPPPSYVPLTTDGTMAYWEAPRYVGDRAVADIMAAQVDGSGKPRVLVKGAKLPQPTRQGLFYVRSNDVAPDVTAVAGEIRRRGSDGRDAVVVSVPLTQGKRISEMCASNGRLAWTVDNGDRAELYVRDEKGRTEHRVLNNDSGGISLACGNHFVAWGGGSGSGDMTQYVWGGQGNPILRIADSPGMAWVKASGDLFGWSHLSTTDPSMGALTIARLR